MVETEQQAESEETVERRWEAAPAVLAVIGLQLTLALVSLERHWKLWKLPWWVWIMAIVPETILLFGLASGSARSWLERIGHRRKPRSHFLRDQPRQRAPRSSHSSRRSSAATRGAAASSCSRA